MKYVRCRCGNQIGWTSMGSSNCEGCEECNTTLSEHPDFHDELEPHEWVTKYNVDTGEPYQMCKNCMIRENNYKNNSK